MTDEALNRGKIAAEIHLNPDYLSSVFREKSGQPLSLFIAKEPIGKAKKLLITTDRSANCGSADPFTGSK